MHICYGHPNANTTGSSWAESPNGKEWARRGKSVLPANETLKGEPYTPKPYVSRETRKYEGVACQEFMSTSNPRLKRLRNDINVNSTSMSTLITLVHIQSINVTAMHVNMQQ